MELSTLAARAIDLHEHLGAAEMAGPYGPLRPEQVLLRVRDDVVPEQPVAPGLIDCDENLVTVGGERQRPGSSVLRPGFYVSTYLAPPEIPWRLGLPVRHDQSVALWELGRDGELDLHRVWELERLSGRKHHAENVRTRAELESLLAGLLARDGLAVHDVLACWGTPGLEWGPGFSMPDARLAPHAIAHLYTALAARDCGLTGGTALALAVDGGPDHVLGRRMFQYAGGVMRDGRLITFPVESPGPLFDAASRRFGLEAGSLMALATAMPSPPEIETAEILKGLVFDRATLSGAGDVRRLAEQALDRVLGAIDERSGGAPAPGFTREEARAGAAMAAVQEAAWAVMARNVSRAIQAHQITPGETTLALAGGFALNCPTTERLMDHFGFGDFAAPPCVDDGGQALGMGLAAFHALLGNRLRFRLPGPFLGGGPGDVDAALARFGHRIVSVEEGLDRFPDDVERGPVGWVEGRAEIGPRALGHRSLLCDPRHLRHKDAVNRIKRRQWWRPVAPALSLEHMREWFEDPAPSPLMLRLFRVRRERIGLIPAVVHLDGTARCQTIDGDQPARLQSAMARFAAASGVPILGLTSLNDRGEPLAQSAHDALGFCVRRGVRILYVEGLRVELEPDVDDSAPPTRAGWPATLHPSRPVDGTAAQEELYTVLSDPELMRRYLLGGEGRRAALTAARERLDSEPELAAWTEAFVKRRGRASARGGVPGDGVSGRPRSAGSR